MEDDGGVGCSRVHSCCPSSLVLSSQSRPDSAVLTQVASVSGWRALATPSAASPRLTEHRHVGCCTTCHPGSKESSSLCPESKKHPTQDLHPPPRDRYCNLSSEIQFRGVRGEKTIKSHLMPPPTPLSHAQAPETTVARRNFFLWGANFPHLSLIWYSYVFSLGLNIKLFSDL